MPDQYNIVGASLQSGMADIIREVARTHCGDLHISGGSLIHIQVRLPAERTQDFIDDVNARVCGRIHWSVT